MGVKEQRKHKDDEANRTTAAISMTQASRRGTFIIGYGFNSNRTRARAIASLRNCAHVALRAEADTKWRAEESTVLLTVT